MASLSLRDYQHDTIDAVRAGFRAGHRAQMLYLPTGGGKTEIAISMLDKTSVAGNKGAMVMDRRVLVDQTSQRLDKYDIDHGVMMAGHWRYNPESHIQICSAQTLEKRESFPGMNLLIIDEAHNSRESIRELIKNRPEIRVIGLSASPFTKGLGAIYTNVISKSTTKELVENGSLAPLRVFIAKEIDMDGAKKKMGEWSSDDVTERGIKITGDIVQEWIKKTYEIFNGPKKTIVFCAGVAHGQDLSLKFKEAGYNFVSISYKDTDEEKEAVLKEFSRPDSSIHGLIATDILTKGFDCILEGSLINTNNGLIPIDKLSLNDKVWDGREYVNHGGAIYRGEKDVITYCGLTATRDHRVKTAEGWLPFGVCAEKQIEIITTGNGREAIQEHENYFTGINKKTGEKEVVKRSLLSMRVRRLWRKIKHHKKCFNQREVCRMQELREQGKNAYLDSKTVRKHEAALSKSFKQALQKLWGAWDRVQIQYSKRMRGLDSAKPRNSKAEQKHADRQNKKQWSLRGREFKVGKSAVAELQYSKRGMGINDAQVQNRSPGNKVCRQDVQESVFNGFHAGNDNRKIQQEVGQAKGRVWDILNAGPRNSFTCNGLLVHNCADVMIGISARPFSKSFSSHVQQLGRIMRPHGEKTAAIWLDHSGNFLRFRDQWDDLFENGVHALDDGAEKPKKEPTQTEKEAAKCPKCGGLWETRGDTCTHCGYTRARVNQVIAVAGSLEEIQIGKSKNSPVMKKTDIWNQCCSHSKLHSTPINQKARSKHLYKGITGLDPEAGMTFEKSILVPVSDAISRKITNLNMRYAKGMKNRVSA